MKIENVPQRLGDGNGASLGRAIGMLTVHWCERGHGIPDGDPRYHTRVLDHIDDAVQRVMTYVVLNAPRHAASATVGDFLHNRTFVNGAVYWSASYPLDYFTEVHEGEVDLRRADRCRSCFADHLTRHEAGCPLRGEDRWIYVGADNLPTEVGPHQHVLKHMGTSTLESIVVPETMAPALFQRMRAYKEDCTPWAWFRAALKQERALASKGVP